MSTDHSYGHDDFEYGRNSSPSKKRAGETERSRPTLSRRRGKSPQSVNGIHKRRRRKMSW
ncbi:hypothetical protein [Botrimarina sp.]|uniref:hypothetical protein n=1 Tax=Botrimarina sp. TaxID=2795802 RepID=UPI0032EB5358